MGRTTLTGCDPSRRASRPSWDDPPGGRFAPGPCPAAPRVTGDAGFAQPFEPQRGPIDRRDELAQIDEHPALVPPVAPVLRHPFLHTPGGRRACHVEVLSLGARARGGPLSCAISRRDAVDGGRAPPGMRLRPLAKTLGGHPKPAISGHLKTGHFE